MSGPQARKTSSLFRMDCAVELALAAPPERVWKALTTAEDFPRWNSTVSSLEGPVTPGTTLKIRVPVSDRTFTPKVSAFEPASRMVWSDGMSPMFLGERTFTLNRRADGGTDFSMVEVFSGLMLPLIRGSLPDFGPIFERYASDLKAEVERA